jgi:hypothetical protein
MTESMQVAVYQSSFINSEINRSSAAINETLTVSLGAIKEWQHTVMRSSSMRSPLALLFREYRKRKEVIT